MKKIGLTGNIACGKSTAAKILKQLGYAVLDADFISKQLCEKNEAGYVEIIKKFGKDVLDSNLNLDRQKLRDLVFSNPEKKNVLEKILHPLILKKSHVLMKELAQKYSVVFYEATLLFEASRADEFDGILLITCKPDLQLKHLLLRNPELSKEMAVNIIASQLSQEEKSKKATWTIENNSNESTLQTKITDWAKKNL